MQKLVKQWVENVIIDLNLCPFAKTPFNNNQVRINVTDHTDEQIMMKFFLDELELLHKTSASKVSNSLVCFSKYQKSFEHFYGFVSECESILESIGLDHKFQVVCFHPDFKFRDSNTNEKVNLVNSSPCALIHILRTDEVEKVSQSFNDIKAITNINEKKLNSLDDDKLKKLFPWKNQQK